MGQRSCTSWAPQPLKLATLSPQPGGKTPKFIRTGGDIGKKKYIYISTPLVKGVHYSAKGLQTHLQWRVRHEESELREVATLGLRQALLYCSGQNTSLATGDRVMALRKKNNTKPGRRKEQISSNNNEENGNHTEETLHGPTQIPPNIRAGQENGK